MLDWLKHAFSAGSPGVVVPSTAQADAIDRVCCEIVRRRMTLPAQLMFESSAPLHFIGGQMLRFVEPVLGVVLDAKEIRDFASFVEQRGSMEYICKRLEALESARNQPSGSAVEAGADSQGSSTEVNGR